MGKKIENIELQKLRHSTSHVMADAVVRLFPGTILGIGPAIEDGFYYDFDAPRAFTTEDLIKIEEEMRKIVRENLSFLKKDVSKKSAEIFFSDKGEKYKLELLEELPDGEISFYSHGNFTDLCRGPHIKSTGEIKAFKLLSVAGAYWKGSEKNPMLQRIYGTCFETEIELDDFLKIREEAEKRDHRKLGKELDLFSFNDIMGAGFVLYHPKGAILRQIVVNYITSKHLEKGYELISSPHILKSDIWIKSGHYSYYKENMYTLNIDEQEFAVKPMNCPGHILVYASKMRSYKEFPLRYFELGTVYRYEKSGVLHGLLRVRGFTQDDAHIFCLISQVESEISGVIDFVKETLNVFGFRGFEVELSTRPAKSIGDDKAWEMATNALINAMKAKNLPYEINEGDGAFYGPKIDIKIKDAIGRSWQCATIQCDFALPERFNLTYVDSDGVERRPVMLHRVILGSLERFIGALIEHYGGNFPLWLAPVQVKIVPIGESHVSYADSLKDLLKSKGWRVEVDSRDEKMQKKIRDAEMLKIPYVIVAGNKEMENGNVSLRRRKDSSVSVLTKEELVARLSSEIEEKLL
ncbi:threonyl-tRNA synthetase [Candidatus Omnitrophus magneticus]|uniref:Threonine--tRNA ligase n=1 Tax=Candidatus Omnitrophus magneticus TaxID=1609969 RepID=A0A0F0CRY1_9BACT|nr:threonyl-tRNA synthetase [Candidatus Omnitrophus magneticus]